MRELQQFRQLVQAHRRALGRTQQELARALGLHPNVLSHKLHGRDGALLTHANVVGIVFILVEWGALTTQAEARVLLELMAVPSHAIPAAAWATPPLAVLTPDRPVPKHPVPAGSPTLSSGAVLIPLSPPAAASVARTAVAPLPLPEPATPLIGRVAERAAIHATLVVSRLVTLTGVGGTGKTRLAIEVAHEAARDSGYGDGVAFVDLAPVHDPVLVALTISHALGLTEHGSASPEAALVEALRPRHLLLVVDNLEHLLEEASLLARLLVAVPRLHILATSRVPLHLYGEHELRVAPLPLPRLKSTTGEAVDLASGEAVQLFVARARAASPDFALTGETLVTVAAICAALDGLPLAIELAAARVKLFPPGALLSRLDSRLAVLTGGARNLPERQQTMRAALDWSYALLLMDEQILFASLGVFAGSFDAAAAAMVCAVGGEENHINSVVGLDAGLDPRVEQMLGRLAALADQSLLEVVPGSNPRFRMLATVRAYALARLAEAGRQHMIQERHLLYYVALAEEVRRHLTGPQQGIWLARQEVEHDNVREALGWTCEEGAAVRGLHLAAVLRRFWASHGHLREGQSWLEALLALPAAAPEVLAEAPLLAIRAHAVRAAGSLAWLRGDYPQAASRLSEALTLWRNLNDTLRIATVLTSMGNLAAKQGAYEQAAALHEESLVLKRSLGDVEGAGVSLGNLGRVAFQQGDHEHASALLEECLALKRQLGDTWGLGAVLTSLARVAIARGDYAHAAVLLDESLALMHGLGDPRGSSTALSLQGRMALLEGDIYRAATLLSDSLRLCTDAGMQDRMAEVLEDLAQMLAATDSPLDAARLGGAADALRAALEMPLPREQQDGHQRMVQAACCGLGEAAFATAWQEGQVLSLEEALLLTFDRVANARRKDIAARGAETAEEERQEGSLTRR